MDDAGDVLVGLAFVQVDTMRNTLELLIVSAIGGYCMVRMYQLMPGVIAECQAVLAAGLERWRVIEEAIEDTNN